MLKSMTAFSRVQESNDSGEIVWELKSVNHRYLEPGFKLPEDFRSLEPEIRQRLGKHAKRGKIDISLRYIGRSPNATPAVASTKMHEREQDKIVTAAFADVTR